MASDQLTTFRAQLKVHRENMPAVARVMGLDATLSALDAALVEQARRQADVAAACAALERAINRIAPAGSPPIFTDQARERLAEIIVAARDL